MYQNSNSTKYSSPTLTRRDFIKNLAEGVLGLALAGCVARECSLDTLEKRLGARWTSLSNGQKDRFRNGWGAAEDDVQRYMVEIYTNPEKIYRNYPKDEQKCFRKFVNELDQKTVNKYKEALPWMNPKQLTLADQLFIYWIERVGYIANLR